MSNLNAVVLEEVKKCVAAIERHTGKILIMPKVEWSNKMTRMWGRARFVEKTNGTVEYIITLSSKIFTEDSKALRNTVAHEVAHIADYQLYGQWGHGETWAMIMTRMLGQRATRLATKEEVAEIGLHEKKDLRRKMLKFIYTCGCQDHLMSPQAHNKIRFQGGKYHCRYCQGNLTFTNKLTKA